MVVLSMGWVVVLVGLLMHLPCTPLVHESWSAHYGVLSFVRSLHGARIRGLNPRNPHFVVQRIQCVLPSSLSPPFSNRHRSNRGSRSSSKSVSPRGRGHHDKTTPTRHSRSHAENKRGSVSPGVYTAGKQSSSAAGLSPSASSIPHGISQVSERQWPLEYSGTPL